MHWFEAIIANGKNADKSCQQLPPEPKAHDTAEHRNRLSARRTDMSKGQHRPVLALLYKE